MPNLVDILSGESSLTQGVQLLMTQLLTLLLDLLEDKIYKTVAPSVLVCFILRVQAYFTHCLGNLKFTSAPQIVAICWRGLNFFENVHSSPLLFSQFTVLVFILKPGFSRTIMLQHLPVLNIGMRFVFNIFKPDFVFTGPNKVLKLTHFT